MTTSFQRFSSTVTLGATVTQLSAQFGFDPVGTAGADDSFQITGIQLEASNVATTYARQNGTIQGELDACQRYYWLVANGANKPLGVALTEGTTVVYDILYHPVEMRTTPTLVQTTGTNYYTLDGVNYNAFTGIDQTTGKITELYVSTTGLTDGKAGTARCLNASASIALSAEL